MTEYNCCSLEISQKLVDAGIVLETGEQWENVLGYEGLYLISNHGRVFSFKREGNRKDRLLVLLKTHTGAYRGVDLHKGGKCKKHSVHRMVATAFIDNPNGYNEVNHKDGIPSNNHVNNLEWVSRSQNQLHAYATGMKSNKGEKNSNHELTEREVKFIRYVRGLYPNIKTRDIADFYGISSTQIRSIFCFKAWRIDNEK